MEQNIEDLVSQTSGEKTEQPLLAFKPITKTSLSKTLLLIIGAFVIGGISGYILGLKVKTSDLKQRVEPAAQPTTQPSPSIITLEEGMLEIIDGSLYKILSSGENKLLIDKQGTGEITDFYESTAPDKLKSFLMIQGGISLNFLYYLSPSEADVKQIGIAQEAVWSNNSRYIAYSNKPADAGPIVSVFIYDTQNDKKTELSGNYKVENLSYSYLGFNNLRWLDDDSGIQVRYDAYTGEIPYGEKIGEGETILKVKE